MLTFRHSPPNTHFVSSMEQSGPARLLVVAEAPQTRDSHAWQIDPGERTCTKLEDG
jgi:hypothetical protein